MAVLLLWDVCHILAWKMNHTCEWKTQTHSLPSQQTTICLFEETITLVTRKDLKVQDNILRI